MKPGNQIVNFVTPRARWLRQMASLSAGMQQPARRLDITGEPKRRRQPFGICDRSLTRSPYLRTGTRRRKDALYLATEVPGQDWYALACS